MNVVSRLPLVSVVVPAYNNAEFVAEAITSILSQTFTDFELILSDHGSTDATWSIMQGFTADPRVHLLRMARTKDPRDNWANATDAATGRYLKLVCADDLLAPGCLEQQVAAMAAHPNAVMVASRRNIVNQTGNVMMRSWGLPGLVGEHSGPAAVRHSVRAGTNVFGEPACVLLRRDALQSVGGWDATYPYVVDQHTYSKVLMHGSLVGLAEPLASFRLSRGQWSQALAREQLDQVFRLHGALALMRPGLLSRSDLASGRWRARTLVVARRAVHRVLTTRSPMSAARQPSSPVGQTDALTVGLAVE